MVILERDCADVSYQNIVSMCECQIISSAGEGEHVESRRTEGDELLSSISALSAA